MEPTSFFIHFFLNFNVFFIYIFNIPPQAIKLKEKLHLYRGLQYLTRRTVIID